MAVYRGTRVFPGGITKDGVPLSPVRSQAVVNHSEAFEWGYGGSGPAQLSLALLLEEKDEETAREHYQEFKWEVVAIMPNTWELTSEKIQEWLKSREQVTSGRP